MLALKLLFKPYSYLFDYLLYYLETYRTSNSYLKLIYIYI